MSGAGADGIATGLLCPACLYSQTYVIDSRANAEGDTIRRRRKCEKCGHRFTTYETALTGAELAALRAGLERTRTVLREAIRRLEPSGRSR